MLAVEDQYGAQVQELDDALARQRALVSEIEALASQLLAQLDVTNAEYRELEATWQRQEQERKQREEAERQRRAAEEERKRREAEAARAAAEAAAATATTRAPETSTIAASTTTTVAPTTTTTTPSPTTTTVPAATTTTVASEAAESSDSTPTTTTSTTVPTPTAADRVCPVDGASSFSDSWGAPRSGGRTHKGVDMSASKGTPLVAMEAGGVYRLSNSSLGGISLYLIGNSGDLYYYAHLDAWADGIAGGQRVAAGDLVGYVGTTGNSPSWLPHLHLGWKPGNGDWANPYPMVNELCR
jgi:peptidoglycan LD-endopeptidase LytH